jgi:hypothetical protein
MPKERTLWMTRSPTFRPWSSVPGRARATPIPARAFSAPETTSTTSPASRTRRFRPVPGMGWASRTRAKTTPGGTWKRALHAVRLKAQPRQAFLQDLGAFQLGDVLLEPGEGHPS